MAAYPYTVTNPSGEIVLQAAGYIVRLHGRKITKTETRKEMRK